MSNVIVHSYRDDQDGPYCAKCGLPKPNRRHPKRKVIMLILGTANEEGWSDGAIIDLLTDFVDERGLYDEVADYLSARLHTEREEIE